MKDYNHYNDRVNPAVAERLLDLNRRFYADLGREFSATRLRLQPGVIRLLATLRGDESILDLGCGNGELARTLSKAHHRGAYLGLDFSPTLLAEASSSSFSFPCRFLSFDLTIFPLDRLLATDSANGPHQPPFHLILCFAVLHHIPTDTLRADILCKARELLAPTGRIMLSNWCFTHSSRFQSRLQPWSEISLTSEDVDRNDYLLDWKRGGRALRFVHEFTPSELTDLAGKNGFEINQSFYSDGADRRSSLYQVWNSRPG